ncbi:hypothetical protein [Thalassobacillus pellis]|uniref:hypothetical protein n=1 Tax=Thalassobacillus pellis TaxID=748008 RepID=UPI00195F6A82|nr:hypothetical protein [Thalassobacillus pellis]MBM7553851.1 heme/copper-type cytochrome/quinol oxidase subunit 4 [Thalassobacillus pellis]
MDENNHVRTEFYRGEGHLPWKHVLGFTLCIILTALSVWGTFHSGYSPKPLLVIIAIFSFSQAILQLFFLQSKQSK